MSTHKHISENHTHTLRMTVRVRVSERVNGNVHKQMSVNEGRRKMKAADLKIRKWDVP